MTIKWIIEQAQINRIWACFRFVIFDFYSSKRQIHNVDSKISPTFKRPR